MKNKVLVLIEITLLVAFMGVVGHAITANPASGVTADSANTATTVVYRDGSGNFAAGTITAASVVTSGPSVLASKTIAQLQALVPAIKDTYFCTDCTGAVGATGKIVIATGTSAGNWADAAGGVFK